MLASGGGNDVSSAETKSGEHIVHGKLEIFSKFVKTRGKFCCPEGTWRGNYESFLAVDNDGGVK